VTATGAGCAVLAVDLDHFKAINDREGHHAGDVALMTTAARLAETVRAVDTVLRIGGDEFLVIAPDVASLADAKRLAERLVAACDPPLEIDGKPFTVSVSVGLAAAPWHGVSGTELLDAADAALYDAKRSGRSRWAMARRAR